MNIGTMGGAFLSQSVTGMLIDLVGRSDQGLYRPEGYRLVFAALAGWLLLSLASTSELSIRIRADMHQRHNEIRTICSCNLCDAA